MKVGDLVEYIDDSKMPYKYPKFIGQLALVEIETPDLIRVRWLKKNYCGPWSDFDRSRFKILSEARDNK
jgi:hypothetical protein